jgi:PAS domain S-box-containing protein
MPAAPIPPDESDRVRTVRALGLLEAAPDERFDSLTRQAQRAFGVPVALITLVDADRERFISCAGTRIHDVPRERSFGAHAILGDAPLVVSDAAKDPRFSDNPLVHEGLKVRFYAGIPLTAADGRLVGTFCVVDRIPRQLNETQMRTLFELARHAERELASAGARAPLEDASAVRMLEEMRRSPRRRRERQRTVAGFLLAAAAIGGATALSLLSVGRMRGDSDWVEHAHEVDEALYDVRAGAQDAGGAARGYARTGDASYLQTYEQQRVATSAAIERTRWLVSEDPDRQIEIAGLRRALSARLDVAQALIQARRARGAAATYALMDESLRATEALNSRVQEMRRREHELLGARRERAYDGSRRIGGFVLLAALLALLLIGWAMYALDRDLRARLTAQAAAETTTARMAAILDGMEDGVIVVDAEGRRRLSNPAAERILGSNLIRVEPVRYSEVCRFYEADGVAPLPDDMRPIVRSMAGESTRGFEFRMVYAERPEGMVLSASSAPIRGLDGEALGAVTVFQDVTTRRRAEQRRALQYEITRALVQAGAENPIPAVLEHLGRGLGWALAEYWELDEGGARLTRARSWREPGAGLDDFESSGRDHVFGAGEGLPGRAWSELAPVWIADASEEPYFARADAARRADLHGAFAFPLVQGRRVFGVIAAFSWAIERPDEDLVALAASLGGQIGLYLDRRRAQDAAARSAAERQAVFNAATEVAIISTDVDGTIQLFNTGATRMLGYSAEELSGKRTVGMLFPRAEISARLRELAHQFGGPRRVAKAAVFAGESLLSGGTETREWNFVRKDGALVPVQLIVSVIRGPEGHAEGFLGIATDITVRKRAEEEMARARDMALRAAQLKSDFLANMSHEIRTPMNAIIGMTGLLLETKLDARQNDFAQTVRAAGDALLAIINDILDFSKIEAGKMRLESIPFDLRAVAEGAAEMVGDRARAKGLELTVSLPPGVPTGLRGDPNRLRQVLLNLLGNAVKFTEAGEVGLFVECLSAPGEKARLRFAVRDTGIGIAAEAQRDLFQSFTQADASTTRRFGGSGLGLAICKQLVELMGGKIGLESSPGRGSVFWCELAFDPAPEAAVATAPRPNLEGLRVLVVDDNPVNRRILAIQLESWRMTCAAVETGAEALERLRGAAAGGAPYSLAILDMHMPGMDGLELARRVRAEPALAMTRLIMLSSSPLAPEMGERRALGIAAHLTKPVRQSVLLDSLESAMAGGSVVPDSGPAPAPAPVAPTPSVLVRRRCRILVVDDNEVNRRIVALQLEKLGYACETFDGAESALARLKSGPAELMLLDCSMPGMDGYEAAREIRRREAGGPRRLTIVAMTAHALEGDRERCLRAGMDDYLAKPVRVADLARALSRWDPPLNAALVGELAATAGNAFPGMAEIFIEHAGESIRDVASGLARGDGEAVHALTHGLRGSAGSFGAIGVVALAEAVEAALKNGALEEARAIAAEFPDEFARAARALRSQPMDG